MGSLLSPFKLIVVSPEQDFNEETQYVANLFDSGLQLFHLRKPSYSQLQLSKYINSLPIQHHSKIVIHSHFYLTTQFSLKGIHLNEKERTKHTEVESHKNIISTSFHSIRELLSNTLKYEYVFLSPIYNSISKKGYNSSFNPQEIDLLLLNHSERVIALGGISDANIYDVKKRGFNGAALLGYIWEADKPIKQWEKLQSVIA